MVEPTTTTTTVAIFTAIVSSTTLAILGVDYNSLVGALVGAIFALSVGPATGSPTYRIVLKVMLTTLAAAMLGSGIAALVTTLNKIIIAICFVCGAGIQVIVATAISSLASFVKKIFGG